VDLSTAIISVIDGLLLKQEAQRWSQPRKRVADKSSDRKPCVARIRRAKTRPTKHGCAGYRPFLFARLLNPLPNMCGESIIPNSPQQVFELVIT
jgi:hypothetical protein